MNTIAKRAVSQRVRVVDGRARVDRTYHAPEEDGLCDPCGESVGLAASEQRRSGDVLCRSVGSTVSGGDKE